MTPAQREHAKHLCDLLYGHRGQLAYPPGDRRSGWDSYDWGLSEAQLTTLLMHGHGVQWDCSEMASWVYKCVGAWPAVRGPGYTGTWLQLGLQRYHDGKGAGLAAPVVFGIDLVPTGEHMGLVYAPDFKHGDPLIAQHGRPGFDLLPLSQTAAAFRGSYTFLNVSRM